MVKQTKPLSCWSITVAENYSPLPEPQIFDATLDEFYRQWAYQGERGANKKKRHYQCRALSKDPQYGATLVQVMSMRGIDVRDITILVESNKSIAQGGLSFYVMDNSKDVFLSPRTDPTYMTSRPRYFVPEQCQHIVDTPRPWMISLLDIIEGPPDHRAIHWVCTLDGLGGVSKSGMNTYLHATGKAYYLGDGTPLNLKQNACIAGERRCFTLDLPKTFDTKSPLDDYINALETVKNGFIMVTMHGKPRTVIFDVRPHEIVFANRFPNMESMTQGRFILWTIDASKPPEEQTLDRYTPFSL